MRLYLAVAVLMLAFVAYTDAQDQEEQTIEQKFADFTQQMSEASENVATKAKETFEQIKNSQFVRDSQTWIDRQLQIAREKFAAIGQ